MFVPVAVVALDEQARFAHARTDGELPLHVGGDPVEQSRVQGLGDG